jgi:hypothetical protein
MKQSNIFKNAFGALAVSIILSCSHSDIVATVNYRFQGCFGGGKSQITLYKVDTDTVARLESDGEISRRVRLSSQQVDTFNLFITELKTLNEYGGCTTVSYYTVFANNETFKKTDGSCDWNGFDKIKECLFGNNNHHINAP